MPKILIFTRHADEITSAQISFLRSIHGKGKKSNIQFDCETRFSGTSEEKIEQCVSYFRNAVRKKYICYVVLPKYMKEALLKERISFHVLLTPQKTQSGNIITEEHYIPTYAEVLVDTITIIQLGKKNSAPRKTKKMHYVNTPKALRVPK